MNSSSFIRAFSLLSLFLLPALSLSPKPARACGNEVVRKTDILVKRIASAEKALGEGAHVRAVVGVLQAFPTISSHPVGKGPLSDRGLRVIALAAARANGALDVGGVFKSKSEADRSANLEFAVKTLRAISKARKNAPNAQTDLGEALSKLPHYQAEALKILDELASKDLLTSAEGYAALMKLKAKGGDEKGRAEAHKRCEKMARDKSLCQTDAGQSRS